MTPTIEAFPLSWPEGWPRRVPSQRKSSTYRTDFGPARDHLVNELRLMRARDVVISSNVPTRRDGLPYVGMREPQDPGVAVFWTDRKGEPKAIACDVWRRVRDNLHALGLAVEYLRALERTGATEILERAFGGFARLAAGSDHWGVLGIPRWSSRADVVGRFRELAAQHHPDRGGDPGVMASITAAYHAALGELERGGASMSRRVFRRGQWQPNTIDFLCHRCLLVQPSPPLPPRAVVYPLPPGWAAVTVNGVLVSRCAECVRDVERGSPVELGGGR